MVALLQENRYKNVCVCVCLWFSIYMCLQREYLGIFFFLIDFPNGSRGRGGGGAGRFGTVREGGLMGALDSAQHE